jgi:exodeoxyribonuclease VII small subunit
MSDKSKESVAIKIARLDELVAWFDSDNFAIEKALEKFSEAEALAREIEHDLAELKNDIEVVKARFDQVDE